MGLRIRKSIKIAPGVKLNLNKKSTSVTFGGKGFHHTVSSTGRKTTTVGVPGTGISYSKTSGGKTSKPSVPDMPQNSTSSFEPPQQNKDGKKWYEKTGWIIFFLIVFFPVGLFLMWKSKWKMPPKIIVSVLYALGIIVYFTSPKLESVTLAADTEQVYDINYEIPIEVSTTPKDYSLSVSSFSISGGDVVERNGDFLFISEEEGEYTVSIEMYNVDSNKLIFKIEDKAAIAQAEAQAEKEAQEKAEEERIKAEQEAAAQAEAERIKEEQETAAQAESQEPQEQMVYISQSGEKYHSNPNCSGMNNPRKVTLSEAQSLGLEACKKCY